MTPIAGSTLARTFDLVRFFARSASSTAGSDRLNHCCKRTVNLSGQVTRMEASGSGHWGLLLTHITDFGSDPKFLGPRSSMLCSSDVIAAEVEEVIDLIVG
jgi:hypothetical protein